VTEAEGPFVAVVDGDEDCAGCCCCFFLEKKDIERNTELKVILYGCDGCEGRVTIILFIILIITKK
jgi:hypothetical protein